GDPDWIVNASINWNLDRFSLGWNGRYEASQLLFGLTTAQFDGDPNFADPANTGSSWVHDFNFNVDVSQKVRIFGGLNNAFDRQPYLGALTRPAGPRGRFAFLGLNFRT
ncbi:MAG: TonB-dependent receptor, partial [Pseudomonadota bacterium]